MTLIYGIDFKAKSRAYRSMEVGADQHIIIDNGIPTTKQEQLIKFQKKITHAQTLVDVTLIVSSRSRATILKTNPKAQIYIVNSLSKITIAELTKLATQAKDQGNDCVVFKVGA